MSTSVETKRALNTEPLCPANPEWRIRSALGWMQERLPEVTRETLQQFHAHLAAHLSFPFSAQFPEPVGLHAEIIRGVEIVGLHDPADSPSLAACTGVMCRARAETREFDLPLADMEVAFDDPNHELIEDYWYWFWNWR